VWLSCVCVLVQAGRGDSLFLDSSCTSHAEDTWQTPGWGRYNPLPWDIEAEMMGADLLEEERLKLGHGRCGLLRWYDGFFIFSVFTLSLFPFACIYFVSFLEEERSSVVCLGTVLQAIRSRVRLPMRSLDLVIYLILPAALWLWSRLILQRN
jgi:hypothetical protein